MQEFYKEKIALRIIFSYYFFKLSLQREKTVLKCKVDQKEYFKKMEKHFPEAGKPEKRILAMLEKNFKEVYEKFELIFFRRVFEKIRERDGSLSAMEAFSLEVIYLLNEPTVGQFADFLNISQSNATYKVNSLIRKGYIERLNSQVDRREYHLVLSEKFLNYVGLFNNYEHTVMQRCEEYFTPEEVETFDKILRVMSDKLMPECDR